jgi:hypothetical protein
VSANAISEDVGRDSNLSAELAPAPRSAARPRADKQVWLLGVAGILVVATVIILSIYFGFKYLL